MHYKVQLLVLCAGGGVCGWPPQYYVRPGTAEAPGPLSVELQVPRQHCNYNNAKSAPQQFSSSTEHPWPALQLHYKGQLCGALCGGACPPRVQLYP